MNISYNRISEIKNLPSPLFYLYIAHNKIVEIKNLPPHLSDFDISDNPIKTADPLLYTHRLKFWINQCIGGNLQLLYNRHIQQVFWNQVRESSLDHYVPYDVILTIAKYFVIL